MDLNKHLPESKKTFEDFRKWLFIKMNKDVAKFKKFMVYPEQFKVVFLFEYLEGKGVPIVEALNYYAFLYPGTPSFNTIAVYTIIMEFRAIESGVKTNYIPF